ncbi:unnamed protein product, partial [Staurois parvus]
MLIKSTDTVLMTLGRKGLTSGAIKGLTVCCLCFTVHGALYCSMQSNAKQHAGADREEICIVYIQTSPPSVMLGD